MEPYYTKAEDAIGSTHRGGRAPYSNNNYKVFAEGAKRVGKFYATGLMEQMLSHMMKTWFYSGWL